MPRFKIRTLMIVVAVAAIASWSVVALILPVGFVVPIVCALLGIGLTSRDQAPVRGGQMGGCVGGVVLALVGSLVYPGAWTPRGLFISIVIMAVLGVGVGILVELCVRFLLVWSSQNAKIRALRQRRE